MRPAEDLEQYTPAYRLLEESRKSWDHAVSDELVYCVEPSEITADPFREIAENYRDGSGWIEVHLTFIGERNTHYAAAIESLTGKTRDRSRQNILQHESAAVSRNAAMFIDVAESVQPPQEMAPNGRFIPSQVRLKRFDDSHCICGYPGSLMLKPAPGQMFDLDDRKLGMLRIWGADFSEVPDRLIQGRPKAVEEISHNQRDQIRNLRHLEPNHISSMFQIIFAREGIRIAFGESLQFGLKGCKVYMRPGCFQIGIGKT